MSETAIADWFITAVRERRIKSWGWFESVVDNHPNIWVWIVNGPSSMRGFTQVTPYNFG